MFSRRSLLAASSSVAIWPLLGSPSRSDDGRSRTTTAVDAVNKPASYRALGVGGGGAMGGLAFSPHEDLWFVGTDMGTLFRSRNRGRAWEPVHNFQAPFRSDLALATCIGFGTKPDVVLHAVQAGLVLRSVDGGIKFHNLDQLPAWGEVSYWLPVLGSSGVVLAATEVGLFRSIDDGNTWRPVPGMEGKPTGTSVDRRLPQGVIYHGTEQGIFTSVDDGATFRPLHQMSVAAFAAGFDARGATLAVLADKPNAGRGTRRELWVARDGQPFVRTNQEGGDHLKMAERNSGRIYVTGGKDWPDLTGTSVWVSDDRGVSFERRLLQLDEANGYRPWPRTKIEYSAVALDIGWDDGGYNSFAVSQVDAGLAGGTGAYFLHVTEDGGGFWRAPFTEAVPLGSSSQPEKVGQRWRSRGLEVVSIRYLRFHPSEPLFGVACGCDHQTLITDDGGDTWRVKHAKFNTTYDVAFDPSDRNRLFGVMNAGHDWGHSGNYLPELRHGNGGLYLFDRKLDAWSPVPTPGVALDVACLAVVYDAARDELFVGTQGHGIVRGRLKDGIWSWLNDGLAGPDFVVPQLAIDPVSGDVYALLSASCTSDGNSLQFANQPNTGIYRLDRASNRWALLRRAVEVPAGGGSWKDKLLAYPTSFAIDFTGESGKRAMYLTDIEVGGQWRSTGVWRAFESDLTWRLVQQHAGAYHVALQETDSHGQRSLRVYLSGNTNSIDAYREPATSSGALHSDQAGETGTWKANDAFPVQAHLWSTLPNPNNPAEVIYTCFGGGMYVGPRPT